MTAKALSFSAKTDYGLVALLELASTYASGQVLQVAEIAQRQQIPDRYLEQMLTSLRRAGILRSIRGPRGGYQLSRAPTAIAMQLSASQRNSRCWKTWWASWKKPETNFWNPPVCKTCLNSETSWPRPKVCISSNRRQYLNGVVRLKGASQP